MLASCLPLVLAIEIAIVAVHALPLPADTLALGAQPLRILDRHGELIAELPADGAGQLTPAAELRAVAV